MKVEGTLTTTDTLYTRKDLAAALGVSVAAVRHRARTRGIAPVMVIGSAVLYTAAQAREIMADRRPEYSWKKGPISAKTAKLRQNRPAKKI